ncbi:hypothetical protein KY321_00455 [Candidatus Woesearchaeota archaeon]|nr:hypothetical protein [Candidatus Woesearchaeota archaeon]
MNEVKARYYKEERDTYELMVFEELTFNVSNDVFNKGLKVFGSEELFDKTNTRKDKIFIKTDKEFYVSFKDYKENIHNTGNYRLQIIYPNKTNCEDVIVGGFSVNHYSYENTEEYDFVELTDDDINKLKDIDKCFKDLHNMYNGFDEKILSYARQEEIKNNVDLNYSSDMEKGYKILYTKNRELFIDLLKGINNINETKEKLKIALEDDYNNNCSKIDQEVVDELKEQAEEEKLEQVNTTRNYETDNFKFDDKVITLSKGNESEVIITLDKSFPIFDKRLYLNDLKYKEAIGEGNSYSDSKHTISIDDVSNIHRSNYYKLNNNILPKILNNKENVTITRNERDFRIEFVNDRIKVNDLSMNKQHTLKIFNMWFSDVNINIKETIDTYKMLGVRKQKIVDEVDTLYLNNVGLKKKQLNIPIEIIPVDKGIAKLCFLGCELLTDWKVLLDEFMTGNRVCGTHIYLSDLIKMGFEKKQALEKIKQFSMLQEI